MPAWKGCLVGREGKDWSSFSEASHSYAQLHACCPMATSSTDKIISFCYEEKKPNNHTKFHFQESHFSPFYLFQTLNSALTNGTPTAFHPHCSRPQKLLHKAAGKQLEMDKNMYSFLAYLHHHKYHLQAFTMRNCSGEDSPCTEGK